MKNFELLFEIIPNYPELNISIINERQDGCVKKLIDFCLSNEANLYVKTINELDVKADERIYIEKFSFEQPKYNKKSLQYDFLFLCSDSENINNLSEVFKKCYRVVKNAANLFVLCKKENSQNMMELLEETNYVAISLIELNDEFKIVSAKKMHGWRKV
jgi:hypothetical protein